MRKRIGLLMMAVILSLPSLSCGEGDLQKVKNASNDIVIGLDAGIEFARDAQLSNLVSLEAATAIRAALVDIRNVARVANDKLQAIEKFDAANKADLLKVFSSVTSGLLTLNQLGTLHLKNEDAKRRFALVMAALNAASRIIQSRLK